MEVIGSNFGCASCSKTMSVTFMDATAKVEDAASNTYFLNRSIANRDSRRRGKGSFHSGLFILFGIHVSIIPRECYFDNFGVGCIIRLLFGGNMSLVENLAFIRKWLFGESHNSVYCSCGNDLAADESFVSDTEESDGNHVRYKCKKCGECSDWDFDIAPVALKRPFISNLLREGLRDPECRIVDLESGKTIKERGERWLLGE